MIATLNRVVELVEQTLDGPTELAALARQAGTTEYHLRAAYDMLKESDSFVRPFAEVHAVRVSNDAFTEAGTSPFRLAVEGQADTALIGVAGLELGTKMPLSTKVTLRPFASAAVEYGSPRSWTTTARFAGQWRSRRRSP